MQSWWVRGGMRGVIGTAGFQAAGRCVAWPCGWTAGRLSAAIRKWWPAAQCTTM
jgi:hypothetical protein